jgi:hypothetical protein
VVGDEFIVTARNCVRDQGARDPTIDCEIIVPSGVTPERLHCFISFVPICEVLGPSQNTFLSCFFPREGPAPQDLRCNKI